MNVIFFQRLLDGSPSSCNKFSSVSELDFSFNDYCVTRKRSVNQPDPRRKSGANLIEKHPEMLRIKPLCIDFTDERSEFGRRFGQWHKQALARAVGMKHGVTTSIVDATAGLGRDSFLLATLGAEVTMIERNDAIHALLADALARAHDAGGVYRDIVGRMRLLHGDAIRLLPTLAPAVVVVDPMHPPRGKSALVKAEMRQVRSIVGTDDDKVMLINAAIAAAAKRAVVKWPAKLQLPEGVPTASHQIAGKTTRFDVFMRHRH